MIEILILRFLGRRHHRNNLKGEKSWNEKIHFSKETSNFWEIFGRFFVFRNSLKSYIPITTDATPLLADKIKKISFLRQNCKFLSNFQFNQILIKKIGNNVTYTYLHIFPRIQFFFHIFIFFPVYICNLDFSLLVSAVVMEKHNYAIFFFYICV